MAALTLTSCGAEYHGTAPCKEAQANQRTCPPPRVQPGSVLGPPSLPVEVQASAAGPLVDCGGLLGRLGGHPGSSPSTRTTHFFSLLWSVGRSPVARLAKFYDERPTRSPAPVAPTPKPAQRADAGRIWWGAAAVVQPRSAAPVRAGRGSEWGSVRDRPAQALRELAANARTTVTAATRAPTPRGAGLGSGLVGAQSGRTRLSQARAQ